MGWKQWPFRPRSLTDMIGPDEDQEYNERFVSLLVSGCSERLGRPLTVIEPVLDAMGEHIRETDPNNAGETRVRLKRIDQINPREHFARFCDFLRELPGQDEACQRFDVEVAHQVIQATKDRQKLAELAKGYPCRMNLIDQVAAIYYDETPVSVVFSGQFLPDGKESRRKLHTAIDQVAIDYDLLDAQRKQLHSLTTKLRTRDKYILDYVREVQVRKPTTREPLGKNRPTVDQLFLGEVREIERIARAQFEMHKRNRESEFRHKLRQAFPSLPAEKREIMAQRTQPILEEIRQFCGTKYLALFISPRRFISYEESPSVLPPFVFAGIRRERLSEIQHFNWRKAGLTTITQKSTDQQSGDQLDQGEPSVAILSDAQQVRRAVNNGLKGKSAYILKDAMILCHVYLSDAYRAVLVWGPFPHLTTVDLRRESHFLEEISELVMTRVLSAVQLSDSQQRTEAWGEIAGLLGHYSRRAMTPVSTGVRIISDYLQSRRTYAKEDAVNACGSLETAVQFISQAVRAPLFSFAATAEQAYRFAPVSLNAIVHDCAILYRPMALEKEVTVRIHQDVAELPDIEADAGKIRDAIGYVLDNAIKYSHRNKEVRIYGEYSGGYVQLTIEDFGQGIEEDELHLIFGRGYQGKRSRKAIHEEGEGMGLFHARLIVEAHKGKIWADCHSGPRSETSSRLEGYLVRFTVELPIRQSES